MKTNPGYDTELPSQPPFMYIESEDWLTMPGECHGAVVRFGVLSYGAYNAMGLIGPERGGVAVVTAAKRQGDTEEQKKVLSTKHVGYNPAGRALEYKDVADQIETIFQLQAGEAAFTAVIELLQARDHDVRIRVGGEDEQHT